MAISQFSYLLVVGDLNYFYSFTITYKAVNFLEQVSVWKLVSTQ